MAHPAGNTTGVSIFASELDGKRQQLLTELVPPRAASRPSPSRAPRNCKPCKMPVGRKASRSRSTVRRNLRRSRRRSKRLMTRGPRRSTCSPRRSRCRQAAGLRTARRRQIAGHQWPTRLGLELQSERTGEGSASLSDRQGISACPADDRLAAAIEELPALDTATRRKRWTALFGLEPAPRISRDLLIRGAAYRLQEQSRSRIEQAGASPSGVKTRRTLTPPKVTMSGLYSFLKFFLIPPPSGVAIGADGDPS